MKRFQASEDRLLSSPIISPFHSISGVGSKDGSLIDISLTVSPAKNAQGKIVGASKIARDITDRKRADERIAALAREAEHRSKNILATA